ncbi:MAG: hypothetical protein H8E62_04950 [Planctomycetes bacterium]|nr:hypothetical protein [Planctomycetota bacterium]
MKRILVCMNLFFIVAPCLYAIDVTEISEIRLRTEDSRSELDSADRSLITQFWDQALNTMLLSDESKDIVEIRRQIEDQKGTSPLSFYTSAFISAAKEGLKAAFLNVQRMEEPAKMQMLEQNLMILTAQLKHPELAEIALSRLDDKDPVIRYWAARAVTNSGVIQILSSEVTANDDIKAAILNGLKQRIVFEQQADIVIMIINFAGVMDHPTAREILQTIAEKRIESYMNWTVEDEQIDTKLLIAMGNVAMIQDDVAVKASSARQFARLYSLVFQRFMIGQEVLSDRQIDAAVTVILEVDKVVLAKMLNIPKTGVSGAIQQISRLEREYESIFGDRLRKGDLATLYQFEYGEDASGKPLTQPPQLPEHPADINNTEE